MADDYPPEHDRYLEEMDRGGRHSSRNGDEAGPGSREERSEGRHRSRELDEPGGRERDKDRGYKERDRERDRDYDRKPAERYREDPRERERERERYRDDRYRDDRRERRRSRSGERERRDPRDRERGRGGGGRGDGGGGEERRARSRHGSESEDDGYGGYVPRKRQDGPNPTKYEKPLPPGAGPSYISDPYHHLRNQNVPTDPKEAQRVWIEQQLKSRQMVLQQQAASAAAANSKTQRELYVGNLVPGAVTDMALRQLFNATLLALYPNNPPGLDPVVNVNLHSDGRYAFVEFRTPDMATAALALNGQVQLLGQSISVGRPSGYVDPSKATIAAQHAAQALAAFQAGDMAALAASATAAGMNLAQLGLGNLLAAGFPAAAPAAALVVPGGGLAGLVAGAGVPLPGPPPLPADQGLPGPPVQQPQLEGVVSQPLAVADESDEPPTAFICVSGMVTAEVLADDVEYDAVLPTVFRQRQSSFSPKAKPAHTTAAAA